MEDEYFQHSTYLASECDGPDGEHRWLCDDHHDLVEFIKSSDVLKFDVRLK